LLACRPKSLPCKDFSQSAGARSPVDDATQDVCNAAGAIVEDQHILAQDAPAITRRKGRQQPFEPSRQGHKALLQSGGQLAVTLQMLFEAGRKVSAPLGEPGRQSRRPAAKIGENGIPIVRREVQRMRPARLSLGMHILLVTAPVLPAVSVAVFAGLALKANRNRRGCRERSEVQEPGGRCQNESPKRKFANEARCPIRLRCPVMTEGNHKESLSAAWMTALSGSL
jgi:hypothetical protein